MSQKFVPLRAGTLAKSKSSTFVPTVVARPASADCAAPAAAVSGEVAGAAPELELQRDGDRVIGVTIRCRCGETIQLELQ